MIVILSILTNICCVLQIMKALLTKGNLNLHENTLQIWSILAMNKNFIQAMKSYLAVSLSARRVSGMTSTRMGNVNRRHDELNRIEQMMHNIERLIYPEGKALEPEMEPEPTGTSTDVD